ncbi:helix-turn-helix domain-containing protein [Novosphingobium sp.]|uniref:helix-turn-helix domain-containing protein n=1 Tax=Novosphingobium sp. TaxID=1874826 RepID=UPI00352A4B8E
MPSRGPGPHRVKLHRTYSVEELARCCGVHKNTVRHWQKQGLEPIDTSRPTLFAGTVVRAFLARRTAGRKRPCPPGTLYCFHCRQPRRPALDMVDYVPIKPGSGNLKALCATCETTMHRRAREADLPRILPGIAVQFREGPARLKGCPSPSLNCDLERKD